MVDLDFSETFDKVSHDFLAGNGEKNQVLLEGFVGAWENLPQSANQELLFPWGELSCAVRHDQPSSCLLFLSVMVWKLQGCGCLSSRWILFD